MRILVDIGHPAHVHYFRNLIAELSAKHSFYITCRDTHIIKYLLNHYGIPYEIIGTKKNKLISKILSQVFYAKKIRELIVKNDINIAMGVSGAAVHGALATKAKSIMFDDDDQKVQPLTAKFVTPFADTVLSPDSLCYERLDNVIYYPGFHELAYLHPKVFTPTPSVLAKYGISSGERYFILRFNAFKAHHDIHEGGMNIEQKRRLVRLLDGYGRVFISTEASLDQEFERFRMTIAPEDVHDFIAFASMLVSDSQTMTSEAAVLGIPSFRCNTFAGRISYLEEEEKRYGLTQGFLPHQFDWMIERIQKDLKAPKTLEDRYERRERLISDKINVSAFWIWFVENYPESEKALNNKKVKYSDFF